MKRTPLPLLTAVLAALLLPGCAALQQPLSESARVTSGKLLLDASAVWRDVRDTHEDAAKQVEQAAKACKQKADEAKQPLPAWSRESEPIVLAACASYGVKVSFRPFLVQDVGDKLVLARSAITSAQEARAVLVKQGLTDASSWITVLKSVATVGARLAELLGLASAGGMPFAEADGKDIQAAATAAVTAAEKKGASK